MLVSHRKKFIYTKTMKTAGTSVEAYFERWCVPEGTWTLAHYRPESVTEDGIVGYRGPDPKGCRWFNHMPAASIREGVGDAVWNGYFKFCVVRNPFDRMVSAFHFVERENPASVDAAEPATAAADGSDRARVVRRFRAWIAAGASLPDLSTYTIAGKLCVDFAIRYESLLADLEEACRRVGVPFEPERLPRLKAGFRPAGLLLRDYYDVPTAERVKGLFTFDLEHFGYSSAVPGE